MSGVHDRVLAFARERGLTVRERGLTVRERRLTYPPPTANDRYAVELPKGELLIEVVFENTQDPEIGVVSAEEWFVTVRDALTSEELWNDRFSYWEWFDHLGDAMEELSDREWFERMGDQLMEFLDAVLTNKVRLAQVAKKPLFQLFGWRWPNKEKTTLQ